MEILKSISIKIGLFLLQIAPQTKYDLQKLKSASLSVERAETVAVEFRNQRWFSEETQNLLKNLGVVFCDVDSLLIHFNEWVTSPIAYIRLPGRKQWYAYDYSPDELDGIARHARKCFKVKRDPLQFLNRAESDIDFFISTL